MAAGDKPRKPGPDIPDLAAPRAAPRISAKPTPAPGAARAQRPRTSERAGPVSSPAEYFGSGTFDFEGLEDDKGPLAIDTDPGGPGGTPFGGDAFGGENPESDLDAYESTATSASKVQLSKPPATAAASAGEPWPTAETPDSASIALDSVEIGLAADYGPPPSRALLAPVYAARVLSRQRVLRPKIVSSREALGDAERRRDDLVRRLAESLRDVLAASEVGAALFAPVAEIENLRAGRQKNLEGASVEYQSQAAAVDHELQSLERTIADKRQALSLLERELDEKRRTSDRAEARKKRLFIELRGILDVIEKSGGGPSPEQAKRIDELETQIAAHKPELDRAVAAKQDAEAAVLAAEREIGNLERVGREAERRRGGIDAVFKKQIGAREKGLSDAESERAAALADVGRKILAARGRLADVPKETLAAIAAADAAVARHAADLEKYVRAIDGYDRAAVRRGLVVGGVAVLVLFVVLVSVAFRGGGPATPEAPAPSSSASR